MWILWKEREMKIGRGRKCNILHEGKQSCNNDGPGIMQSGAQGKIVLDYGEAKVN